jgi:hypothetical protein
MNNPPAFPVQSIYIEDQETNSRGMTLRDYFASQVACNWCDFGALSDDEWFEKAANAAYKMADAMLKAREE